MVWVRRAGILLTVLVLALAVGGAAAGAKKKHKKKGKPWGSQLTLTHPSANRFAGAVGSKLAACRGSRVVILFYTDPNNRQTSPLSVQLTGGDGKYQIALTKNTFAGEYQAEVVQRKIRAMKRPQTCRGAVSPAIVVP
jgi:hypothetical protein